MEVNLNLHSSSTAHVRCSLPGVPLSANPLELEALVAAPIDPLAKIKVSPLLTPPDPMFRVCCGLAGIAPGRVDAGPARRTFAGGSPGWI